MQVFQRMWQAIRSLIDDGLIGAAGHRCRGETKIHCTVVNGGELGQRKGVNVPKVKVSLPALTEKDKEGYLVWYRAGL